MQNSKAIIGYDNVSYEEPTLIPDQYGYIYFVPVNGVHFTIANEVYYYNGMLGNRYIAIAPFEIFCPNPEGWANDFVYGIGYPSGKSFGRNYVIVIPAHNEWISTGNLGYKTIAEYNALLATMDNITKRNLQGDRVY